MTGGSIIVPYYTSMSEAEVYDAVLGTCAEVGFDVEDASDPPTGSSGEDRPAVEIPYDDWFVRLRFNLDEDRGPNEPVVSVGSLTNHVYPPSLANGEKYSRRMDVAFELLCRLAVALEADYVALGDLTDRLSEVVPDGRPIGQSIGEVPRIGVFARDVLEDLGGLEVAYDDPWFVGELTSGQTVVIESSEPWSHGGWEPPTEAPYLESAELRSGGTGDYPEPLEHGDPFAALEPGEYGTDFGVHPDDIAEEFRNEDLRLERVYVAEDGTLRRVGDDAFVRRVVEESTEDVGELLQASLADAPPTAGGAHYLASALFHWAIRPEFVRLEHPDGENVVSRVADLEADVSKFDLLRVLGDTTFHEDFDEDDYETIEGALDTLDEFASDESIEGVERVIRERLF